MPSRFAGTLRRPLRTPRHRRVRSTERGAALLTAMIVVVMVATLATSMVWQQWKAIQVEESERSRTQSALILTGALDWARLILREDAGTGGTDNLNEPWAVPLAEARLSTFLAADKNNTDTGPEAFLSGQIIDATARYNLMNVTDGEAVSDQQALKTLFDLIGVAPEVATQLITNMKSAFSSASSGVANRPLRPETLEELRWFGLDIATIKRLEPYVIILPTNGPINMNTAPREVIAAVLRIDLAAAARIVQARQSSPFKDVGDIQKLLGQNTSFDPLRASVKSDYFEVRGRLRLADRVLEERSLVQRVGRSVNTLQRQRISSQDATGFPGLTR